MLRTLTVEQYISRTICSFSPVPLYPMKKLGLLVAKLSTMVNNFKRVPRSPPLLVSSKHFTDIHLKTAKMVAFDNAPYIQ